MSAQGFLELTTFVPSKSVLLSNYLAKYGGILSRGNMTHFQGPEKPLDFTQLLLMRQTAELSFLPLDMRAFSFGPHFFTYSSPALAKKPHNDLGPIVGQSFIPHISTDKPTASP